MKLKRRLFCVLLLAFGVLGGCGVEIEYGQFACDPEAVDPCPPGHACLIFGAGSRCFSSWQQNCGNEVVEPGELCDGSDFGGATCRSYFPEQFPDGADDRPAVCLSDCTVTCSICGDGFIDGTTGELCDEGRANSDEPNATCRPDCRLRTCGDGIVDDASGEQCDGTEPLAVSCITAGLYNGVITGCNAETCRFNLSPCEGYCGDGIINGPEECDGADQGGLDCLDLSGTGGRIGCDLWCNRILETCGGHGFTEVHREAGVFFGRIWVAPDRTLFVTTSTGMLRYDGTQWIEDSFSHGYIPAVWGRSSSDVYFTDAAGLWHYDGTGWTNQRAGQMHDVWGVGAQRLYVVKTDMLETFDGSDWVELIPSIPTPGGLQTVWASAPNDVYVGNMDQLLHFDGQDWTNLGQVIPMVNNLWGTGPDNVIVPAGGIYQYDGQSLTEVLQPQDLNDMFEDVWGSGPNDIYVGGLGRLIHFDGTSWQELDLGSSLVTNRSCFVGGSSRTDVWVSGEDAATSEAVLWHLAPGSTWETIETGAASDFTAVWGSGSEDVWAVGTQGVVLHYDGTSWSHEGPTTTADFVDVGGVAPGVLYAATASVLWNWDGFGWTSAPDLGHLISKIWVNGIDDVYVAGMNRVHHFDGQQWTMVFDMASQATDVFFDPRSIWRSPDGILFVGGEQRTVTGPFVHYEGGRLWRIDSQGGWQNLCGGENFGPFVALWGNSSDNIFVAAEGDIWNTELLRFDGQTCVVEIVNLDYTPTALWGTRSTNVFMLSGQGRATHFDGSAWSRYDTGVPSGTALRDVWGVEGGPIFAVGDAGTILRMDAPPAPLDAGPCGSAVELYCGQTVLGSTAAQQTTIDSYAACGAGLAEPGAEVVYRIRAPLNGKLTLRLTPRTGDLDLFVMEADATDSGRCDLGTCVGYSQTAQPPDALEQVQILDMEHGDTYYVVVDSPAGGGGAYAISAACELN